MLRSPSRIGRPQRRSLSRASPHSVSGQVDGDPIGPKYYAKRAGGVLVLELPLELVPLPLRQYNNVPDAFRDYLSVPLAVIVERAPVLRAWWHLDAFLVFCVHSPISATIGRVQLLWPGSCHAQIAQDDGA